MTDDGCWMTDGRNPPSSVVCGPWTADYRPPTMDHRLSTMNHQSSTTDGRRLIIGAGRLCSATPVFGLPPLFMSCYLPFSTFNPSRVASERGSLYPGLLLLKPFRLLGSRSDDRCQMTDVG